MVNFICQLGLATECADIEPNNILNVSLMLFLDEINV